MSFLQLDINLSRRIELAEAHAAVACAEAMERTAPGGKAAIAKVAGGFAVYCGSESPITQAVGLGFDGPVSDEEFDRLEDFYRVRGETVRVETSPMAHPSLIEHYGKRGYRVTEFSNVMALNMNAVKHHWNGDVLAPGITVERVAQGMLDLWTLTVSQGFAEHYPVTAELLSTMKMFGSADHAECYLARVDGKVAGGAGLSIRDGVAGIFGASTLPAFRNRGVQTSLLRTRLERAVTERCDLAVCLTQVGSGSQRNILRHDFRVLYSRAKFERAWDQ